MASIKDSLFGMMAVRAGFASEAQVTEAIREQEEYARRGGKVPRLGELLAHKGLMTAEQVQAILAGQHREKGGLFGEIVVRWKLATQEQVDECLAEQRAERARGRPRKLGEIMLYKGYLQVQQLAAVLEAQKSRTIACSGCAKNLNIAGFRPGDKLRCAGCGAVTGVPPIPGFSSTDFHPVEVEVTPTEAPEAAAAEAAKGTHCIEIGGYEVVSRLGQDATGTTLKARHLETDTMVMLRVMRVTPMQDEAFLRRFIEEGKKGTQLIHKYAKRIYEVGLDRGRYYYSSEYVEGKSLKRLFDDGRRFTPLEAIDLLIKVAQALEYAHNNGVVHGDLRPSSVILTDDGGLKVADLGIAKDVSANLRYFARSSEVIPLYVAPEVAVDEKATCPQSDIYSLGTLFYHMIVGKPPYEGANPLEVLMRISEEEAPSPHRLGVTTEGLSRVIMKMTALEPEERYGSMTEVIEALREHMRDAALSTSMAKRRAVFDKAQARAGRRLTDQFAAAELSPARRRSRALTWFLVAVFLVLGGVLAWYFELANWYWERQQRREEALRPMPPQVQMAQAPEDQTAYQEVLVFINGHPDDPAACLQRLSEFLARYPASAWAPSARKEAEKQKEAAARISYLRLLRARDDFVSRNDYTAAVAAYDQWLPQFADTQAYSRALRDRRQLLADEKVALEPLCGKARWLAGQGRKEALDLLRGFRPSKAGEAAHGEAIAEVERLLAEATAPEPPAQPPPPTEVTAPAPQETPAPAPEQSVDADEVKRVEAAIRQALLSLDAAVIRGAAAGIAVRTGQGRERAAEAKALAEFLATMKARLAGSAKDGLDVTYQGVRQRVSGADDKSVLLKQNVGGTFADMAVPWAQLPSDTLWNLFQKVLKNTGEEHGMLGLLFVYRGERGYALQALGRAAGLGYAKAREFTERLKPKEPGEAAEQPAQPAATPALPSRITFDNEAALKYLRIEAGTWQVIGNALQVHGDVCKAALPTGPLKGFLVVLEFKELNSTIDFTAGNWRIGLDGIRGQLLVRDAEGVEKVTAQTIVSGFQYDVGIEITADGAIYTFRGAIVLRDKNTAPQGDALVVTAHSSLGVLVKEIRLLR